MNAAIAMHDAEVEAHRLAGDDGQLHLLCAHGNVVRVHAGLPVIGRAIERSRIAVENLEHHLAPAQVPRDEVQLPNADAVGLGGQRQSLLVGTQGGLHRVLFGHIFQDGQRAQWAPLLIALHGGRQQHVDQAAVFAHHLVFNVVAASFAQVAGQDHIARVLVRFGGEELGRIATDHLAAGIAHFGQPGVADREQTALRVNRVEHRRCRLIKRTQARLAVFERAVGQLALGHIATDRVHGVHPTLRIQHGMVGPTGPAHPTLWVNVTHLAAQHQVVSAHGGQLRSHRVPVRRRQVLVQTGANQGLGGLADTRGISLVDEGQAALRRGQADEVGLVFNDGAVANQLGVGALVRRRGLIHMGAGQAGAQHMCQGADLPLRGGIQLAGLGVHHAQGANGLAAEVAQGQAGVKADAGRARGQPVVLPTRGGAHVGHAQQAGVAQGLDGPGQVGQGRPHLAQANLGQHAVSFGGDQADQGNGGLTQGASQGRQRRERGVGRTRVRHQARWRARVVWGPVRKQCHGVSC